MGWKIFNPTRNSPPLFGGIRSELLRFFLKNSIMSCGIGSIMSCGIGSRLLRGNKLSSGIGLGFRFVGFHNNMDYLDFLVININTKTPKLSCLFTSDFLCSLKTFQKIATRLWRNPNNRPRSGNLFQIIIYLRKLQVYRQFGFSSFSFLGNLY